MNDMEIKDEFDMNIEARRLETFTDWPFNEDCQCTPAKLAEAGFYHCPSDQEPDLVRCYVCHKELDGWAPEDEPWSEHVSHSKACPFVLLKKNENRMTMEEFLKLETERQCWKLNKEVKSRIEEYKMQAKDVREEMEKLVNV
ncbi:PREDICTED: baculoviral IAP repeat-containing protein 5.2-like [Priapulus caudatus]|uniref:Baculoviral IAP repeat-containing protein 5.2-like n=1 Tax=Priapulus caudatus TaxID=37621 RepID=A0ABM1E2S1_PRICU|nr:PREDICTED: baculoviral IAP repeat-containing protein 5.2-like [Priapulus caudatus]